MALENYFDIPYCGLSIDIVQCAKAHDLKSKLQSNPHYVFFYISTIDFIKSSVSLMLLT